MELNAKPTELDLVLVHDKILMAVLGAKGIKPVHFFLTGMPSEPPEYERQVYFAYKYTTEIEMIIDDFRERKVFINLDEYLVSAMELEGCIGEIEYTPSEG